MPKKTQKIVASALSLTKREKRRVRLSEQGLLLVLVLGLLVALWLAWQPAHSGVNSYQQCVAAGNPVLDSYPSQCVTKDGKTFSNPDELQRAR